MKATFTSSRHSIQFHLPSTDAVSQRLEQLYRSVLSYVTASGEPSVRYQRTADNQAHWTAYDPATQQLVTIDSELEMRIWLENRYNQSGLEAN